jgi:hypothetical protein
VLGPPGQKGAVARQERIRRRASRRDSDAAVSPLPRRPIIDTRGVGVVLDRIRRVLSEARI